MIFKKHYCLVCNKHIKWYEKVVVEEKIDKLWDQAGNNFTLYKHNEIRHYDCLSNAEKAILEYEKKQKRKKKGKDDNTTNVDKIYY